MLLLHFVCPILTILLQIVLKKYFDNESIDDFTKKTDNKYENFKLNAAKDEFEKDFIIDKMVENNYNISRTAKALGLYPSNLYSKINKLGIDIEELKRESNF